ncbi:MAG TPA: hypothetical protein VK530_17785 [Candidatus Acidoferrum sp.]|nr:hypothetical protein [Candidatus Acidoferrum sp.]
MRTLLTLLLVAVTLSASAQSRRLTLKRAAASGGGACSPSYANAGGTGNRTSIITVSQAANTVSTADINFLVDGDTSSAGRGFFFAQPQDGSTFWIRFDFGSGNAKVITEAKFYQGNQSHGTWQWQGSDDGAAWTSSGSSFTLGGAATQTQTSLAANTTAYRYYRILGLSGTASNADFIYQFEFKLCQP